MRWLVVLVIACSGSPAPPPARTGPPAAMTATAAPGDVQVATVEGRPVWGSCVTAQTTRGATKQAALDQCIAFELMAIEADNRGLAVDRDVVIATRTALVSELVAREYETKYTKPEDFGNYWTRTLERNRTLFDHPEARGSVYARIEVPKQAPPTADQQAKQLADELYAALATERGLMGPHVSQIAQRVIGSRGKLKVAAVPPEVRTGRLHEAYLAALFAVPEVGRVSPPVRTPWGWDVVLWDSVVPEVHATPDELVKAALPEIKRGYFHYWVNRVAQNLGVKPQLVEQNLPLLENL
ncbi:MAG TPA: peptidylprolyl isomerase [Kofleriaceae bacterium]